MKWRIAILFLATVVAAVFLLKAVSRPDGRARNIKAKLCWISADEKTLLILQGSGRAHQIDLFSGEVSTYDRRLKSDESPENIGPDADLFYDYSRGAIMRLSDPKYKIKLPAGRRFVAFTQTPSQIILFDRQARALQRIELPTGKAIWNVKLARAESAKTSSDGQWLLVGRDLLVRTRDGTRGDLSLWPGDAALKQAGGMTVNPVLRAVHVHPRYVVAAEDGQIQLTLLNLETKEVAGLGRTYARPFKAEFVCLASAPSRRIMAFSDGEEVEIFWSDYLTKPIRVKLP